MQNSQLDNFKILRTLGSGISSKVKLGENIYSGQKYALKILKSLSSTRYRSTLIKESAIMSSLAHKNILKFYDLNLNGKYISKSGTKKDVIYGVIEFAEGGELFEILYNSEAFSKNLTLFYAKQLFKTLLYLHNNGIAHRDLKPENLLLNENYVLKLADFGFSTLVEDGKKNSTFVGSPQVYMAPEIHLRKTYDAKKADVFSAGIVIFILITKKFPFGYCKIGDRRYDEFVKSPEVFWRRYKDFNFSEEFKILINGMIECNPKKRFTMQEVLNSDWVNLKCDKEKALDEIKLKFDKIQIYIKEENSEDELNLSEKTQDFSEYDKNEQHHDRIFNEEIKKRCEKIFDLEDDGEKNYENLKKLKRHSDFNEDPPLNEIQINNAEERNNEEINNFEDDSDTDSSDDSSEDFSLDYNIPIDEENLLDNNNQDLMINQEDNNDGLQINNINEQNILQNVEQNQNYVNQEFINDPQFNENQIINPQVDNQPLDDQLNINLPPDDPQIINQLDNQQLGNQPLDNQPLDNQALDNQPLDNQQLGIQPLDNQQLGNQPLDNQQLGIQPLDNQQLGNQPLGNQQLGIQPLDDNQQLVNQPLDNQQLANQPLDNQQLGNQPLDNQQLGIQPLDNHQSDNSQFRMDHIIIISRDQRIQVNSDDYEFQIIENNQRVISEQLENQDITNIQPVNRQERNNEHQNTNEGNNQLINTPPNYQENNPIDYTQQRDDLVTDNFNTENLSNLEILESQNILNMNSGNNQEQINIQNISQNPNLEFTHNNNNTHEQRNIQNPNYRTENINISQNPNLEFADNNNLPISREDNRDPANLIQTNNRIDYSINRNTNSDNTQNNVNYGRRNDLNNNQILDFTENNYVRNNNPTIHDPLNVNSFNNRGQQQQEFTLQSILMSILVSILTSIFRNGNRKGLCPVSYQNISNEKNTIRDKIFSNYQMNNFLESNQEYNRNYELGQNPEIKNSIKEKQEYEKEEKTNLNLPYEENINDITNKSFNINKFNNQNVVQNQKDDYYFINNSKIIENEKYSNVNLQYAYYIGQNIKDSQSLIDNSEWKHSESLYQSEKSEKNIVKIENSSFVIENMNDILSSIDNSETKSSQSLLESENSKKINIKKKRILSLKTKQFLDKNLEKMIIKKENSKDLKSFVSIFVSKKTFMKLILKSIKSIPRIDSVILNKNQNGLLLNYLEESGKRALAGIKMIELEDQRYAVTLQRKQGNSIDYYLVLNRFLKNFK